MYYSGTRLVYSAYCADLSTEIVDNVQFRMQKLESWIAKFLHTMQF